MPTYKRTIPVEIEFYYEPEEKATEFEPDCPEDFEVTSIKIGGQDVLEYTTRGFDESVYDFLKIVQDDF